MNYKYKIV